MGNVINSFTANQLVIEFIYPLVFFSMGFVILLKNKVHSRFHLPYSLNYLGIFGIIHGFSDWGDIFIPLQAIYLKTSNITALYDLRVTFEVLSFAFLLLFGIDLLRKSLAISRRILVLPPVIFGVWIFFAILSKLIFFRHDNHDWLYLVTAIGNYLLLIPAGLLSSYAIYIQKKQFSEFGVGFLTRYLTFTSISIIFFTIFHGLIFDGQNPKVGTNIPPLMFHFSDLPIDSLRTLAGFFIGIFIFRILKVVDMEYQQFFYQAERSKVVTEERNRIARDLHDGMIQSIYAFGLHLESLRYALENGSEVSISETVMDLKQITGKLNELIAEIRGYIRELKIPVEYSPTLREKIEKLITDLNSALPVRVEFQYLYEGEEPSLPVTVQVYYIVKEALSNVIKHAQATEALILFLKVDSYLLVNVRDNGIGFGFETVKNSVEFTQGIRNMEYRANVIGGRLSIQSGVRQGTSIELRVPTKS